MNIFYAENLTENGGFLGTEESHHAVRVLRVQAGDEIGVTQGLGVIYNAKITQLSKTRIDFSCVNIFKKEERKNYLHIAIAPTKSLDRFENFLEKATEVGIDEITPIICANSERRIYKKERGDKIIKSASKQSLSCWLPKLNEAVKLSEFIQKNHIEKRFIAHCESLKNEVKTDILATLSEMDKALVLIGPEGDFSKEEIDSALKMRFKPSSLGNKRLRTETAGITVSICSKILSPNN